MTMSRTILAMALAAWTAARGVAMTGREPIAPEQIAGAITAAGVAVSAQQITLLSDVVARTAYPALKVRAVERNGDGALKVRLECLKPAECLPFFVSIERHGGQSESALPRKGNGDMGREAASRLEVHAGSEANLVLEGPHIEIQIPVICLESGSKGQRIRVAGKDRRLSYTAEVVDGNQLRGRVQ
jgi:hypothetical protein